MKRSRPKPALDARGDPACVRLSCWNYCGTEYDGISLRELAELQAAGWKDVDEVQSYAESTVTYDTSEEAPEGYSALDWETHRGTCPDCVAEEAAELGKEYGGVA